MLVSTAVYSWCCAVPIGALWWSASPQITRCAMKPMYWSRSMCAIVWGERFFLLNHSLSTVSPCSSRNAQMSKGMPGTCRRSAFQNGCNAWPSQVLAWPVCQRLADLSVMPPSSFQRAKKWEDFSQYMTPHVCGPGIQMAHGEFWPTFWKKLYNLLGECFAGVCRRVWQCAFLSFLQLAIEIKNFRMQKSLLMEGELDNFTPASDRAN